jgi:hypothetical protein
LIQIINLHTDKSNNSKGVKKEKKNEDADADILEISK